MKIRAVIAACCLAFAASAANTKPMNIVLTGTVSGDLYAEPEKTTITLSYNSDAATTQDFGPWEDASDKSEFTSPIYRTTVVVGRTSYKVQMPPSFAVTDYIYDANSGGPVFNDVNYQFDLSSALNEVFVPIAFDAVNAYATSRWGSFQNIPVSLSAWTNAGWWAEGADTTPVTADTTLPWTSMRDDYPDYPEWFYYYAYVNDPWWIGGGDGYAWFGYNMYFNLESMRISSGVPETPTWLALIVGLALIGAVARRSSQSLVDVGVSRAGANQGT